MLFADHLACYQWVIHLCHLHIPVVWNLYLSQVEDQ